MAEYQPPALQNFRPMYQPGTVDATLSGPLDVMHRRQEEGRNEVHQREHERQGRESLGLQGRQVATSEKRADRYADMTNRQENRRETQAQFERSKLHDAQHEAMLHDLYAATTSNDPRAIQYAIDALHRAGYQTEQMEHVADPQVSPASIGSGFNGYDPTLGGTLLGDNESSERSLDNERSEGEKPPLPGQPMQRKQADAQTSRELDAIEADYLPKLRGGAQPASKRYLPGQQIILGAGDSYNNLK